MFLSHNPSNILNMVRQPRNVRRLNRWTDKRREKDTLHHTGILLLLPTVATARPTNHLQDIIRYIPRVLKQRPRDRMRPDNRGLGQGNRLLGRLIARMGQIHQDAQPVQLADQLPPQGRKPIAAYPMARRLERVPEASRRGKGAVAHVRERDVPHAHLRQQPNCGEGIP